MASVTMNIRSHFEATAALDVMAPALPWQARLGRRCRLGQVPAAWAGRGLAPVGNTKPGVTAITDEPASPVIPKTSQECEVMPLIGGLSGAST